MYRTLLITIAAAFALATLPAAADVNLHNGYIVIRNDAAQPLYGSINHLIPGIAETTVQRLGEIAPHSTFIANKCCYAAGSTYVLDVYYWHNTAARPTFVARLCNERGIPHGYAAFAFHSYRQHNDHPDVHRVAGGRTDTACP